MENFYFTYGSDHWAQGGWTVVTADNIDQACDIFSAIHPRRDGFVACAGIYDEQTFIRTKMAKEGNLGKRLVERISIDRFIDPDAIQLAREEGCGPDV